MSLLPETLYLPNQWWSCLSLIKYNSIFRDLILQVIIVKICVELNYLQHDNLTINSLWTRPLLTAFCIFIIRSKPIWLEWLWVKFIWFYLLCTLYLVLLVWVRYSILSEFNLANTSSGTILLFCTVGNTSSANHLISLFHWER